MWFSRGIACGVLLCVWGYEQCGLFPSVSYAGSYLGPRYALVDIVVAANYQHARMRFPLFAMRAMRSHTIREIVG